MKSNKKLKAQVKNRKVENLVHFTRLNHLDSILKNGLINREQLEETQGEIEFNDPYRYDEQENAICTSIDFPNYKMFYRLWRYDYPDVDWVILLLNESILWKKNCAFCVTNAASNEVTCIPIDDRKGRKAFKKLYKNRPDKPPRSDLGIPDNYPTDPQAEVLVFDNIKPKHIIQILTHDHITAKKLSAKYPDLAATYSDTDFFLYYKPYFSPRDDWEYW